MDETRKGIVKEVSEKELLRRLADEGAHADRRTDQRLPARLEVEIPLASVEQLRRVYTMNISKGGLLFSIESPVTLPATVDITITLPNAKQVMLTSDLRHVERREGTAEFEVGVQFKTLDAEAKKTFEQAIGSLGEGS